MDGSHSGHTGTGTRLIPRHIGAAASVQPSEWGLSCGIDAARSFGSEVSAPKFRSDVSGSSQVSGFDLAWQLNGPYRGIDGDLACTHEALASCYLRQGVLRLACRILADGA